MQFSELSIGDQFRLHHRGTLLHKTGSKTFATEQGNDQPIAPDTVVLGADDHYTKVRAPAPKPSSPYGARNTVDFQDGYVRLSGAFTREQLQAVLGGMKPPH